MFSVSADNSTCVNRTLQWRWLETQKFSNASVIDLQKKETARASMRKMVKHLLKKHTMIGPNCVFATANHPILPELREKAYQYNLPIRIGRNCWLGAGVIVVPGVTIGDNTVIGAGSVVTKDIPANVVAVGNPCHVLRTISEHDKECFYRDRKINWGIL